MIGNSCKKDIQGAKKAGWNTIWFNESQGVNEHCEQADASIYHMSQLTELIHILNQTDDI
jgi:FMN phosphatase YigB (HAD superfamily)